MSSEDFPKIIEVALPEPLHGIVKAMIANGNGVNAETLVGDYQRRGEAVITELSKFSGTELTSLTTPGVIPLQSELL